VRVAALADVHANAPALAAVLDEVARERPDLIVFCGDLTWGPFPQETLALVRGLGLPMRFVRGNADRAVGTLLDERGEWILAQHEPADLAFLSGFEPAVVADLDGLGPVRFCHGSPRSDEECVTERTPRERVAELMDGVLEHVVATAHVHVSYDREIGGVRLLSPGSVGLPYEADGGARWALLGPGVELRRTDYDVAAAAELIRGSGDPAAERIARLLLEPPAREEVIADAEERVFAG
jgi:predicted phosphodiesterase